jgi:hypothetical protein
MMQTWHNAHQAYTQEMIAAQDSGREAVALRTKATSRSDSITFYLTKWLAERGRLEPAQQARINEGIQNVEELGRQADRLTMQAARHTQEAAALKILAEQAWEALEAAHPGHHSNSNTNAIDLSADSPPKNLPVKEEEEFAGAAVKKIKFDEVVPGGDDTAGCVGSGAPAGAGGPVGGGALAGAGGPFGGAALSLAAAALS